MKTLVIAEAGSTHGGALSSALELVRIAKQAGAGAVKFQYWSDPWRLATQRGGGSEMADAYAAHALPAEWLPDLAAEAHRIGLLFMCTAFLPEDVPVIAPYVDHFKVASFEAEYRPLLAAYVPLVSDKSKLFVSVGMGADLSRLRLVGSVTFGIVPMHCVSGYPIMFDQANLRAITRLSEEWKAVGYSDHVDVRHANKEWVGALAVAAGASVVEAHLRLDSTSRLNPDYPHSMSPSQFADYAYRIQQAEGALGDGDRSRPSAAEADMVKFKSVEKKEESRVEEAPAAPAAGTGKARRRRA